MFAAVPSIRLPLLLYLVLAWCVAPSALAATDDADVIAELRAQIAALSERLETLEGAQATSTIPTETYGAPAPSEPAPVVIPGWVNNTKIKGDFRYRHEAFDIEGREDRHRQRIRARTELVTKINERTTVGFGLATGGDDPVSTNQTLGGGASSKGVVLDLAYATYDTHIDGLSVTGGKFKNPFHRAGGNGLLWDGDLRPEGAGVTYKRDSLFATAMGLFIDEDSNGQDAIFYGGQFGIDTTLGDGNLITGVGYYEITDAADREVFFDDDPRGNRVNPDGTYVSDFEMLEGFAEYTFGLGENKVTVFGDYVKNLGADDYDTGWALGAKLKRNAWSFGYAYQDLEADAVLGLFTDSDFIGGGTDGKGHILQTGYALSKKIALKGTLFLNDRNVDFGTEEEFKRLMLDISFKY